MRKCKIGSVCYPDNEVEIIELNSKSKKRDHYSISFSSIGVQEILYRWKTGTVLRW